MQKLRLVAEILIRWFVYGMLVISVIIIAVAIFSSDTEGEARTGSFETSDYNNGWTLETDNKSEPITLPDSVDVEKGTLLTIRNTLPGDLKNGSCIMFRATMEDIYIYINGELREQYATESISVDSYYLPSAYVVAELSEKDAGAEISVDIRVKARGVLNEIQLGSGNNVWFSVLRNNIAVNAVALIVLVLGIILLIASAILQRVMPNSRTSFFLGLLMLDIGIWVFSESNLRQLIFSRPTLSYYFAYFSVELIGVLACLFFDEVQHKKYHNRYVAIESVVCIQLAVNIVLQFTHIAEFHETLIFSHIWMACGLLIAVVNVISDLFSKRIREYSATTIGIVCFLVCSFAEMVTFYVSSVRVFGIFVCLGLVMLTVATVIQALIDLVRTARERESNQTKMVVNTIETIAGAIDAKDEYTGGHSERVGHYATILARGMAADYDFSEEDILRIHYIGNMHDIGKIGVTDSILNKTGRLSDDEFCLMKKHVDIGAELMQGIGGNIEGLVDGIHYHHERFDGKGYPKGLSDTEIPLVARIICIADCYDAMTSNRVYRKRLSNEAVRAELVKCSGTQFDPALTEIFIRLMDSGELVPYTVDGMATAETGVVMKSALLENYLQKHSASEETKAKHPTHIRMLCYIMKLKEKKGERVDVFLLGLSDNSEENSEAVKKLVRPFLLADDISIEYNKIKRIIALFGKTDEQLNSFTRAIENSQIQIDIERI